MSNKTNIFAALPVDDSDNEDNSGKQSRKEKKAAAKTKTDAKPTSTLPPKLAREEHKQSVKDERQKAKQTPSSGSHPLERHSGTGHAAFDKKTLKKGGHGKGNAGRPVEDDKAQDEAPEQDENEEKEEEADKGITLEEYNAKLQANKFTPEINEAKAKITKDDLMKEYTAKKATVLVSKKQLEAQESAPQPKKKEVEHKAEINTEYADLLQFRTGFVERAFRDRDAKKPEGEPKKREEKTEQAPAEGEKTEPVEGESPTDDKKRGNRGPRGDNRGDNRGGNRGGNKGGNKGTQGGQAKLNLNDDADFPKLG